MKYFFDTYAIIEIIKENVAYKKYLEEEIVTSVLNMGELYYALLKDYDENIADLWYNKLKQNLLFIDPKVVIEAMKFKFKNKGKNLSFIDCVSYILAKEKDLIFLTGDKEFKGFVNVEFVNSG